MTRRHHLTIAILTRNRPDFLATALRALAASEVAPDDVIVSDDSAESFVVRNRALVEAAPLARYTRGPQRGLGANENHIVRCLVPESQWVIFNGDDAHLPPGFIGELHRLLDKYDGQHVVPTGSEVRNGVWVQPQNLSFLGFQNVQYESYDSGSTVETVVVQATPFPAAELANLRWLEVSAYGYDEVDMAAKLRRLGWRFAYEPTLWLHHDQAEAGREAYPRSVQVARLYFRLRAWSVYKRRPAHLLAFALIAPLHLLVGGIKHRDAAAVRRTPGIVLTAYGAWLRSLLADWRTT